MSRNDTHQARKRFGQNFLHDQYVIQKIVNAISPTLEQTLVEIGPGKGAITSLLIQNCKELHVIEIDRDLVTLLKNKFPDTPNLQIHTRDALRVDYCSLMQDNKLRLMGNLPYNISTPLLFHLLENSNCIEDMHFMLQKEVVDRMAAMPGNRDYGRLSVMIQYHCHVDALFNVGPGAFTPAPKVDSTIVRLEPYTNKPVEVSNMRIFQWIVTQAFSLRRKTIRNALKKMLDEKQIRDCNIDPDLRPEMLGVEDYARLAECMTKQERV